MSMKHWRMGFLTLLTPLLFSMSLSASAVDVGCLDLRPDNNLQMIDFVDDVVTVATFTDELESSTVWRLVEYRNPVADYLAVTMKARKFRLLHYDS
jgi:hypothetical protein